MAKKVKYALIVKFNRKPQGFWDFWQKQESTNVVDVFQGEVSLSEWNSKGPEVLAVEHLRTNYGNIEYTNLSVISVQLNTPIMKAPKYED